VTGGGLIQRETPYLALAAGDPDWIAAERAVIEQFAADNDQRARCFMSLADAVLALLGGDTNAGTIYDSTNYHFVVPSEGFPRALEIMADAIANPLFDAGELSRESEVVIEESNRKLDNPPALSLERMLAVAFTQHRIKRWRIGSNEVLRHIERANLLDFFRTLYVPKNMILAVAGDVKAAEVLKAVQATYGGLTNDAFAKKRGPSEPPQTEFRYGRSTGVRRARRRRVRSHVVYATSTPVVSRYPAATYPPLWSITPSPARAVRRSPVRARAPRGLLRVRVAPCAWRRGSRRAT